MSKIQPKPRLGRGLSSLISISKLPVEAEIPAPAAPPDSTTPPPHHPTASAPASPTEIKLEDIAANPHQPRRQFNEASPAELAASLQGNGLIQPVIVRQVDGKYQLVAGERRLRAAKLAGLETVPAIVREVDAYHQAQMALVENIQREDLNPMDRAAA